MYNTGSYYVYGKASAAWVLTVSIASPGQSYSLDIASGSAINLTIDWGDGTVNNYTTTGIKSRTYSSVGTYLVKVKGSITNGNIRNTGSTAARVIATTPIRGINFNGTMNCLLTFDGCSNLSSIPDDLFDYIPNCTQFSNTFRACSSLTTIPAGLFDNNTMVSSYAFYFTFNSCTGLTSIPAGLFDNNILASTNAFEGTFVGCTGLTSIPTGIFDNNTLVSSSGFASTFSNCSALSSIPTSLFDNNLLVSSSGFLSTFSNCVSLTSIPAGLFDNNTLVSSSGFLSTFSGCSNLASIPANLFDNNTLVDYEGFRYTFSFCTSLTSIPTGLFDFNTLVSDRGFDGTFMYTGITSIPAGLFNNNVNVAIGGFTNTFLACGITSIPSNLFDNNSLVSSGGFLRTFKDDSSLSTVPASLFEYNTQCDSFKETFSGCDALYLDPDIFGIDLSTRFLNQSIDFTGCFEIYIYTGGSPGTAPDLWSANYGTGTPTSTGCFYNHSLSSLTNYASIPAGWL